MHIPAYKIFKRWNVVPTYCKTFTSGKLQIENVLIANRGEIACRIIKTAKRLGIKTVAVYSDADESSLHVSMADEAYHIGHAAPSSSYLRGDKIIEVAKKAGCQAIHPGYGFLSENAEFAQLCAETSLIFIGPPFSAIRDMGIKSTSKEIMEKAGVPIIKGYHGNDQSDSKLKEEAEVIGYPVLLKAVRGGGGKGMRIVRKSREFSEQLASARNEAQKAFGDNSMLVEQFIPKSRHVEVQVFGDSFQNYVYLFERDCSVQRRHQKIIEEAPAPGLPETVRKELGLAAIKAAKAVSYVGAGTVEFIMNTETFQYYFMEMNTRLQVEHPITEAITGTDLVEWQFKVANGEKLPLSQEDLNVNGHAFEARIYAEDPEADFLPSAGTLNYLKTPPESSFVRIETGVREFDDIPVYYDPMIAKLVVWGADRKSALDRLQGNLRNYFVSGVPTNINFLLSLTSHPEFKKANVHTNFIKENEKELFEKGSLDDETLCQAVFAFLSNQILDSDDPFYFHAFKRLNYNQQQILKFDFGEKKYEIRVTYLEKNQIVVKLDGNKEILVKGVAKRSDGAVDVNISINGKISNGKAVVSEDFVEVFTDSGVKRLKRTPAKYLSEMESSSSMGENLTVSPMPGVVDQVLVTEKSSVTKGQPLITIIAMKMEYTIRAPCDGIVEKILFQTGESVAKGAQLVKLLQDL